MRGYRVVEVPMTMRIRGAGTSKKGNNLVYGVALRARGGLDLAAGRRRVGDGLASVNTNRSSTTNLATNMTANAPK